MPKVNPTAAELRALYRSHKQPKTPGTTGLPLPPSSPVASSPPSNPSTARVAAPERHHGHPKRQEQPLSTSVVDAAGHIRTEIDKKGSSYAVAPPEANCPLDDTIIYGLVLRAFGRDREVDYLELQRRCRAAGYPGGAQVVTLANVRNYIRLHHGWDGIPYTAYLTGTQPS